MFIYDQGNKLKLEIEDVLGVLKTAIEVGKEDDETYLKVGAETVVPEQESLTAPKRLTVERPVETTKTLTKITVAGFKTTYTEGQCIDLSNTVVTAYFDDGSKDAVENYTTSIGTDENLTVNNSSVIFSYTYDNVLKSTTKNITVNI